jgi:hypothetical protein
MELLLRLLAIYMAIAGVMAVAVFGVLRGLKKNPSFAAAFIWCAFALFLLGVLSNSIAMLLLRR